jgi:hypothetical protein
MAVIPQPSIMRLRQGATHPIGVTGGENAFESLQGTDFSLYIRCCNVIAGLHLYGRTLQTATLPVFADNYTSPAHNQSNQKAMSLPILDN